MKTEIHVFQEAGFMKRGKVKIIGPCEGCGLMAIMKDDDGTILFQKLNKDTWEKY